MARAWWQGNGPYFLLPTLIILLVSFTEAKRGVQRCKAIHVDIVDQASLRFVSPSELKDRLISYQDSGLVGVKLQYLGVSELETRLSKGAFIKNADIYLSLEGDLYARIRQRKPILRIAGQDLSRGFYIDQEGYKMPLSPYYTARVPLAYGSITEPLEPADSLKSTAAQSLFVLAALLEEKPFYRAFTGQIRVEANNDLVLLPKLARHEVILGGTENLEEKFMNLTAFYRKVLPVKGWDHYDRINLKYKNQVVAN